MALVVNIQTGEQTIAAEPSLTLAERREALIPRIEHERWEHEVGGMTFGGATIPTDDRAKTLITGSYNAAIREGEDYSDEWKVAPGMYVPLDHDTVVALADALKAHIRACFAREKELTMAVLDASTHAAMDDAEAAIATGWP
jgi:hypothetical protein